jgi:predicted nucleic-acid-binding protein
MACCERDKPVEWWDFFAHDPRLKDGVGNFLVRLHRDDEKIADMEAKIEQFLLELMGDAERFLKNETLEEKLRGAVQKAGKYTDAEMMEMLRDEGISVP